MATRPFFTGDYGAHLARVDTRPIIEAGRAQGQIFAQMGKDIGGMIKEYGLNKEKQKKQKANIKSTVNLLDSLAQNDPAMEDQYASMKDQLLNEDISLTERDTLASQGLKQISLSSQLESQRLNRDAQRMANEFAKDTNEYRANVIEDQSILSRLNRELTEELDPKKRELLSEQIDQTIADLSLRPEERKERKMQLRDAAGVRAAYPASVQARHKRELTERQLEGFDVDKKYKEALMKHYQTQGDLALLKQLNESPTFAEQSEPLMRLQGKLLTQTVEVPVGTDDHQKGQRIPFQEYLEFHGKDPDVYPLTGTAKGLNDAIQDLDRQLQVVVDEQPVYVDDTTGPGAASPDSTPETSAGMLLGDVNVLSDAQRRGLQTGAETVTSMIPSFVSDDTLRKRLEEIAESFPQFKSILNSPEGQKAFESLMEKR